MPPKKTRAFGYEAAWILYPPRITEASTLCDRIASMEVEAWLCGFTLINLKKMQQELINIIDELRVISHQVAHTYTREIADNGMDAGQWALLQEALKQINLNSQEAFLMVANLRRNVPA